MRVKYIYANFASVPDCFFTNCKMSQESYKSYNKLNYYLDLGRDYVVYGVTIRDNFVWYYVCDDTSSDYPIWKPSLLFEVVDPRLSRHWIYSYKKLANYITSYPVITFAEWADNHPDFYNKLTDWAKPEMAIFARYKELMDLEFEDPNITEMAQKEADNWLICRSCFEAWECHSHQDALTRCPQCQTILMNPYYNRQNYEN